MSPFSPFVLANQRVEHARVGGRLRLAELLTPRERVPQGKVAIPEGAIRTFPNAIARTRTGQGSHEAGRLLRWPRRTQHRPTDSVSGALRAPGSVCLTTITFRDLVRR